MTKMPSGIHGVSGERVFGAAGQPQNTAVLMDTIYKLKQELQRSDQEKRALAEQLNCLVLLVKRSWSGDQNASLHLGNIVGITPPDPFAQRNTTNTPEPDEKTPAVRNWERLAIRLLDREYLRIQEEIRQKQMAYIENRQLYMDELLVSHQKEMAKAPTRRQPKSVEEVDQKFMKTYQRRPATAVHPSSNVKPRQGRAQSAGVRQRSNSHSDGLSGTNLTLNDIMNPQQVPLSQNANTAFSGLYRMEKTGDQVDPGHDVHNRIPYDDPSRYRPPGNVFDLDNVFGPEDQVSTNKPRPISAFMPRERTKAQRPQSAVFITQRNDRPLKYETTRPVSAKAPNKQGQHGKRRKSGTLRSASESAIKQRTPEKPSEPEGNEREEEEEVTEGNTNNNSNGKHQGDSDDGDVETPRAPIRVNLGFDYQRRPDHVDKFAEDLKKMELMEDEFRKNTIQLQKKLGIEEMGIIF